MKATARHFPCLECGADVVFDADGQNLRCDHCGGTRELSADGEAPPEERDYETTLARLAELREPQDGAGEALTEVDCSGCGATVRFAGTLTSDRCAYCGSPLQVADAHAAGSTLPVDGVLPFRVSRERAREAFRGWVRSRWFAPNAFKNSGDEGAFQGVYTPYWTYDAHTATRYEGMRGDHYWVTVGSGKNRRRVRRTRWTPASGSFTRFFDDVPVVAASGLPRDWLDRLEPWPLDRVRPYRPEFLAGFQARTFDVPLDAGFEEARGRMDRLLDADARARIGGDTQRIHSLETTYDALTYKHLLLPVWMLALRIRDRAYRVVVNAVTGEVQGERPYSWVKIGLAILAAAATILGVVVFTR